MPEKILGENRYKGKNILDLGCGTGKAIYDITMGGGNIGVGIDISHRNIEVAKQYNTIPDKLSYYPISSNELLKQYSKEFDYIISYTVFEHISEDDMLNVLFDIKKLLNEKGKALIVYNHYYDKYGSHLKEFIYHPFPQRIFDEDVLFSFRNKKLIEYHAIGEMFYYPSNYGHGFGEGNDDCFMNLNKLTIKDFEKIIKISGLNIDKQHFYSQSPRYNLIPYIKDTRINDYFKGSCLYVLSK